MSVVNWHPLVSGAKGLFAVLAGVGVDVHRVDAAGNATAKRTTAKHQKKADKPTLAGKLTVDQGKAGELAEMALNLYGDLWPDQRIRCVTALC